MWNSQGTINLTNFNYSISEAYGNFYYDNPPVPFPSYVLDSFINAIKNSPEIIDETN
jgi:hypothetical protein